MGTHLIPRSDVKGQDHFFIFFTIPGLIGTLIALIPALPIFIICDQFLHKTLVGFVFLFVFGLVGFIIGQGKLPEGGTLSLSRKVGGLYIRDIIKDWLAFRGNKKKFVLQVEENQKFDAKEESQFERIIMNEDV